MSEWASATGNETISDVYRAAAAVASLEARRRGIARLRAAGAVVVDAEPGHLAPAVVDTYLDLKARGRL